MSRRLQLVYLAAEGEVTTLGDVPSNNGRDRVDMARDAEVLGDQTSPTPISSEHKSPPRKANSRSPIKPRDLSGQEAPDIAVNPVSLNSTSSIPVRDHRTRGGLRRSLIAAMRKNLGTTITVISTVLGLIIAVLAWIKPSAAPLPPPDVTIESIGVNRLQDVDIDTRGDDGSSALSKNKESAIDIVLHNNGGAPALIRSIILNFDYAQELENCNPGHGPVLATAKYDIRVPTQLASQHFSLTRDNVLFQVPPNAFDRLAVTAGPEQSDSGDYPWLYSVTVTLNTDSPRQRSMSTGRVAFISPVDDTLTMATRDAQRAEAEAAPCLKRNAQQLSRVIAMGGISSPRLIGLLQEYRSDIDRLANHDGG